MREPDQLLQGVQHSHPAEAGQGQAQGILLQEMLLGRSKQAQEVCPHLGCVLEKEDRSMTVEEAFATFDWATFHRCGHPVQRFQGAIAPCSYCWKKGTNVCVLPAPLPLPMAWSATPVPPPDAPFREVRVRLKAYIARDDGKKHTGRIWVQEV